MNFDELSFFGSSKVLVMAEEYRETLLKKTQFYENCPGCKVDQQKELQRGLPIRELVSIWIIVLCAGMCFDFKQLSFNRRL